MRTLITTWLLGCVLTLAASGAVRANTAEFNFDGSGAVLSGYWPLGSDDQGRIFIGGSNASQLDATVVGEEIDLTCSSTDTASITVTVDGVASTPTFSVTNAFATLKIPLGADGSHTLTIKQAYQAASFYLDTGTGAIHGETFTVQGQAPSMGPPTAGFGPQYQLSDVNVTPYIQAEGGLSPTDEPGYPSIYHNDPAFPDEALYFTASATGPIRAWVYGVAGAVSVYIDGVQVGLVRLPLSSTYQWVTLFNGDGKTHRYGFAESLPGLSGLYVWSLMTVGGTLSAVTTSDRPKFFAYGDSITQAQLGADDDSSKSFAQEIGASLGWAVYNRGIFGTTVDVIQDGTPYHTYEAGVARTTNITSYSAGAKGITILYGTNDMSGMNMNGESLADFQKAYRKMLARIVAGVPTDCVILCIGILPRTDFDPDTIAIWNGAAQAAIAQVAAPNVQYVDPADWGLLQNNGPTADYTDPDDNYRDGKHPDAAGYAIMASHILPYFAPPGVPAVTSTLDDIAQIGVAHAYQLTATNAPTTFGASALPAGLSFDAATGLISGTPTETGTTTVTLSATNASGTGTAALTLEVDPVPTVTIAPVGDATAVEGVDKGKALVERTGGMLTPVTVQYAVKGSAQPGVDYEPLSGQLTIPGGIARAKIKVKPLDNGAADAESKVKIKLLPSTDGSYDLGDEITAKIKILGAD